MHCVNIPLFYPLTYWQKLGLRTIPFALLEGMQTGAATVESSMEIPQKIENRSAFWPSNPTSENISKGTQNTNSKEHKHPCVYCSVIYNCQDMEASRCPSVNEWIKQLWDTYTMEYYSAVKSSVHFILSAVGSWLNTHWMFGVTFLSLRVISGRAAFLYQFPRLRRATQYTSLF